MLDNEVDLRVQTVVIGTCRFPEPVTFDDIKPFDFKRISMITSFDRAAIIAAVESDLESLSL